METYVIMIKYEDLDNHTDIIKYIIKDTPENFNGLLESLRKKYESVKNKNKNYIYKCTSATDISTLKCGDILYQEEYSNGEKYDWFKKTIIYTTNQFITINKFLQDEIEFN